MKTFGSNLTTLLLLALTLRVPANSQTCDFIENITHFPAQPSTQDSITIEVTGWFGDCWGCARSEDHNFDECTETEVLDSFRVSGNNIYVYSSGYDGKPGDSSIQCFAVVIPFRFQITTGPLPAGNYSVISLMHHNSLRKPSPLSCISSFTVEGNSPCVFGRGDMNDDSAFTPADVVLHLRCVFTGSGNCHTCFSDVNCDGELRPSDVVLEMNRVFLNQSFPC
ncbi:MAG TPA: hypothetical protein VNL73_09345 [Verrucomicrobiae bacterium]|nr:hypothetical protein [Verrucomicrobiae bacterium]